MENKREKFVRLAEGRVNRALKGHPVGRQPVEQVRLQLYPGGREKDLPRSANVNSKLPGHDLMVTIPAVQVISGCRPDPSLMSHADHKGVNREPWLILF